LAFPKTFLGVPQFLDLTYKALPNSRHLAKFRVDRPGGLGHFAPKPFARKNGLGEAPKFGTNNV